MKHKSFLVMLFVLSTIISVSQQVKPLRIGIAGLTHDHVHGLLARAHTGDIEIVGIAESNHELAERYLKQYNLPATLGYILRWKKCWINANPKLFAHSIASMNILK